MRDITKTLSYQWFEEVWNQGREDSIDKLMHKDSVAHGIVPPDQPKGPAGFKAFYKDFREKFSDIHIEISDVISEDDMECSRASVSATETATGKKVKFGGLCLLRIQDNQVIEAWNHYDFLEMYQQLGQVLKPGS